MRIRGVARLALAAGVVGLVAAVGAPGGAARSNGIHFAKDAKRGTLLVHAPGYDLTLSAKNGAIASLVERPSGVRLVLAQGGCLWQARSALGDGIYIGGCTFAPTGPNRFSYRWNAKTSSLTLRYAASPGATWPVSATVTLTAHGTYFDLAATVVNRSQHVLLGVSLPADLATSSTAVAAGYSADFMPGVKLGPGFFRSDHSNVLQYPGRYGYADFTAADVGAGHLAVYSVNPEPHPLAPAQFGFLRESGTFCSGHYVCVEHEYSVWIEPGASWTSPAMRIRTGEPIERTLADYRHDNGIDAYRSLGDKLGSQLATYLRAPLVKVDAKRGVPPVAKWADELKRLPSPVLLHPTDFSTGAFDTNPPDFLPPDPAVGTMADFHAMTEAAHALGDVVMPYMNLTWWGVDAPTVQKLLADGGPSTFSVITSLGNPLLIPYAPRYGYVVSPYAPVVLQKIADVMATWQSQAPMDCYFFDQLGARTWIRDFNPAEPTPLAYDDGWLAILQQYSSDCLMVEDGWDRLAQNASGFHGGMLVVERETQDPDKLYGVGNWQPFPIAEFIEGDKVLLYQHNLSELTMTTNPPTLQFDAAMGFMLTYEWNDDWHTLDSPWLDVVGSFQKALGPYYGGQLPSAYTQRTPSVTETDFPNLTVVANWSATDTTTVDGYGLPPSGFLARSNDGALVAGSFAGTYDGTPLSPGSHDLVVQSTPTTVTVHQPLGADTQLSVRLPSGWHDGVPVHASVPGTVAGSRYVFTCAGPGANGPAPTYTIAVG